LDDLAAGWVASRPQMRDRRHVPRLALAGLFVVAVAGSARADGDRALSGGFGWGTFSAPGIATGNQTPPAVSPSWGVTGDVVYEQGISTDLSWRAEVALATFHGGQSDPKTQSSQSYAALGDAGLVFRFDVLKYVPYAFGGVGAVTTTGGPLSTTGLAIAIGGGLDILIDRHHSIGIEARLAAFGTDLTVFTIGLRYSKRWDFF
jgi:hypothetical protein